jgi:ATP-dependent helicase/nuclease subunit A
MDPEISNPKPRELKPEQAVAAHTLHRHLSVTAGPGSGKTTVLVERYLEILRTQKVSVDNIVAITFTIRAANEMRERVRAEIDRLLRDAAGDERRKWLRHKRSLEGAVITTIHGFCSRLLHEFPLEANIDPQFVLLDEHEAMMLVEAVVEEALSDAIHHGNERILKLAQGVGGRGLLAATLVKFYFKYRGEGLSLSEVQKRTAANHAGPEMYQHALAELDARVAEVLAVSVRTPVARQKRGQFAAAWPAFRAILAHPPTDETIAAYTQAIEDFWELRPSRRNNDAVVLMEEMIWGPNSKGDDRVAGQLPQFGVDLLARDYALALLKLMHETERRLEDEKQRLSVVDFDDLQLRALKLLNEHPEILASLARRYQFFLVDEFQDTNGLQRDLMMKLGLLPGANLFIVGDRKQSIYGFRGADVDVFREMTTAIEREGGAQQPLHLNFRSQEPLIDAMNFLFPRIFSPPVEAPADELDELGYVEHEPSVAERRADDQPPLVEILLSVLPDSGRSSGEQEDEPEKYDSRAAREHDAAQLVERINGLVSGTDFNLCPPGADTDLSLCHKFNYGDIAILFRALTVAGTYEAAFRRAGIPYLTVQGKGFYQREEITDLIQLLRFLDNTTDEVALAAVLRSPLGGISDNTLFALRSAPFMGESPSDQKLSRRNLWGAIKRHRDIQFIEEAQHAELERVAEFLTVMIERRNRYSIAELLRFAVSSTDFMVVIAANFDGPQRMANVEKLFRLAEIFERTGQLIRDFVHFVEEFEEVGGRESEGQMDKTANVVRLMTIHQAKGLEFPVVIIPEIHRYPSQRDGGPYVLDRHKGFTVAVPDGRGGSVRGALFRELRRRGAWREQFESMRVLYVAATRAKDRLIFSAAVPQKELKNLKETTREQWLAWLWQALELDEFPESGVLDFGEGVQLNLLVKRDTEAAQTAGAVKEEPGAHLLNASQPLEQLFPLIGPIAAERSQALRRFSVTQLINFQRCARQYYFDRLLHTPGEEELAAWNNAETPEPPANLTATLKGAVIHRFCETFCEGDDSKVRLRESFNHVRSQRQAELAGRVLDIDVELAVQDLLPLAEHYLASDVFRRVQAAQKVAPTTVGEAATESHRLKAVPHPQSSAGVWSELRFRLRRPLGILTGTIDKLLIQPAANGDGFDVEIIDFKTNRFRQSPVAAKPSSSSPRAKRRLATEDAARLNPTPDPSAIAGKGGSAAQASFDFDRVVEQVAIAASSPGVSIEEQVARTARDYQLQMQSYALALRELLPADFRIARLRATLHFIDPNLESVVPDEILSESACLSAIDEAMQAIAVLDGTLDAESFPPLPAGHCRICNFLDLCPAGNEWLRAK